MNPAKIVAIIALISLTFGAGLEVNWKHLIEVLKNVSLLVRALLANFVIVPLLGVLIAKLFRLPPLVATGFLLMAIAPGVPFVLLGVRKKGGRLGLAVELAVLLPLISLVTVPLTAALVLPTETSGELPLKQFVVTLLLFQVLPLLIGIVVGDRAPSIAPRLARISQLVFFATILVVLILLAPKFVSSVALVYGSHGMLAILCLTLLSMATGWLLGGPAHEDQRILGIGTTLRNIGLCLVISTASFREPLITATILTYLLIQIIISSVFGRIFMQRAKQEAAA
jgi:BASS family bile acid:Na+ symporter